MVLFFYSRFIDEYNERLTFDRQNRVYKCGFRVLFQVGKITVLFYRHDLKHLQTVYVQFTRRIVLRNFRER